MSARSPGELLRLDYKQAAAAGGRAVGVAAVCLPGPELLARAGGAAGLEEAMRAAARARGVDVLLALSAEDPADPARSKALFAGAPPPYCSPYRAPYCSKALFAGAPPPYCSPYRAPYCSKALFAGARSRPAESAGCARAHPGALGRARSVTAPTAPTGAAAVAGEREVDSAAAAEEVLAALEAVPAGLPPHLATQAAPRAHPAPAPHPPPRAPRRRSRRGAP